MPSDHITSPTKKRTQQAEDMIFVYFAIIVCHRWEGKSSRSSMSKDFVLQQAADIHKSDPKCSFFKILIFVIKGYFSQAVLVYVPFT